MTNNDTDVIGALNLLIGALNSLVANAVSYQSQLKGANLISMQKFVDELDQIYKAKQDVLEALAKR